MRQQQQTDSIFLPAPSTICLLCAACGRRVTPCLVCGNLLPFCGSFAWAICRRCKLRNPFGEEQRRLLGFPPPLALPLWMVRRVQVAHLGRSACVMAAHVQYLQMQQTFAEGRVEDMPKSKASDTVDEFSCKGSQKTNDGTDILPIHLPFLQCEGMVRCLQHTIDNHLLSAWNTSPNIKDTLASQICSCSGQMSEGNNAVEKIPVTDKGEDNCHACDGKCKTVCWELLKLNEAALKRCQEQLLSWHCTEALSADLNCRLFPLCNSVVSLASSSTETDTCNVNLPSKCASQKVGSLLLSVLHSVNSFLEPAFKSWLAEKGSGGIEALQQLEDIVAIGEKFLQRRATILQLQRSLHRAAAAQKQASKDHQAVLQPLKSTGALLRQIFSDRVQERAEKFIKAVEPFSNFLEQINSILEFCYAQAGSVSYGQYSRFLGTSFPEQLGKGRDSIEREDFLEALQTSVSSWLLLYHDVAHATGVILPSIE